MKLSDMGMGTFIPTCREPGCERAADPTSTLGLCGYHDPAIHNAILLAFEGLPTRRERQQQRLDSEEEVRAMKERGQWGNARV